MKLWNDVERTFKCKWPKDIEKALSNKELAAKHNVLKNTISAWVKNKDKILPSLEEGQNIKRQKVLGAAHEALDQAVFKWFLNIRSQNVLLSDTIIQEKASSYAKELNIENFKAWDGLLYRWKERRNITFKEISGESNSVIPEIITRETLLPTLLSNYDFGLWVWLWVWTILQMYDKQNMPNLIRKVFRWKVKQSSHDWHGNSECCWG